MPADVVGAALSVGELLAGPDRPHLRRFAMIPSLVRGMATAIERSPVLRLSTGLRHAAQRLWWPPQGDLDEHGDTDGRLEVRDVAVGDHAGVLVELTTGSPAQPVFRAEAVLADVALAPASTELYRPPRQRRAVTLAGTGAMRLTPAEIERYAELTGDHNPIHLSARAAQAAGLPEPIHPGLFTLARATSVAAALVGRDPDRLTHAGARFMRPVPVGAELVVRVSTTEVADCFRVDVLLGDARVLRDGVVAFDGGERR